MASIGSNHIRFNRPHICGKEIEYISEAMANGVLSGNGPFTKKCHQYFESNYGFKKVLLTTSCTDALEMCAMLVNICPGDEVIVPSYTFVSSALAFHRAGANIVFADSRADHPGVDEKGIEALITPKTKAIVVVHYAGIACDMDIIMDIAQRHSVYVIEDAAQAIDATYKGRPLGGIGHLAAFSFHETKNIISGEGGMLVINDDQFVHRAEILWEKGTNRSSFFRGEVNKYGWIDTGSSFLPSELIAAFLYAQLENLGDIQDNRLAVWNNYLSEFKRQAPKDIKLPFIPDFASNNAHMFYIICKDVDHRQGIINRLKQSGISAVFHYLSLHSSPFYGQQNQGLELVKSDEYSNCLLRLPLYYGLAPIEVANIVSIICGE